MVDEVVRTLRNLARAPRVVATLVVTLTMAIGGAGGLFSLLDAVVLRPLPVRDPARLVAVFPANGEALFGISMPTLAAFAEAQQPLENICGVAQGSTLVVEVNGRTSPRPSESVTGECTEVLGIEPAAGRLLSPADAPLSGAGAPAVIISYRLWQDEFGGAQDIVGRAIRVEGQPLTVIGVLPYTYRGLNADEAPDIMVPLDTMWRLRGGARILALHMVGRMKPGVTLEGARSQLRAAWPHAWQATNPAGLSPAASRAGLGENLRVDTLEHGFSTLRYRFAQPLQIAVGLAVLLILLACVNAGALLLARTVSREPQLAVQTALGASRLRLAASVCVEGIAVAACAGIAALPIAWWISQLVSSVAWISSRPLTMTVTPTRSTLLAMAMTTLIAGVVISTAPCLLILGRNFRLAVAYGRSVSGATRLWRRALVAAQVALSFGLLFCASLLVENLTRLQQRPLGYDTTGLRWARLEPVFGAPRAYDFDTYVHSLVAKILEVPDIESVALAVGFPTTEVRFTTAQFPIERADAASGVASTRGMMDRVSPGFFKTAGIALVSGREFEWFDTAKSPPIAVITQPLANRLFPEGDAVGREIRVPGRKPQDLTVVGVAKDFSPGDPRITDVPRIYVPMMQEPGAALAPVVLMRVRSDRGLLASLNGIVTPLGRHEVSRLVSIAEQTSRFLTQERLLATIGFAFALLGTIVGALGLFALLAHTVAKRTREIGLRMALGATRRVICTVIAGEGIWTVLVGMAVGALIAAAAGTALRALLFEGSPFNVRAFVVSIGVTLGAGVMAACLPLLKATRTDPAHALRTD
jgi:predicted permease